MNAKPTNTPLPAKVQEAIALLVNLSESTALRVQLTAGCVASRQVASAVVALAESDRKIWRMAHSSPSLDEFCFELEARAEISERLDKLLAELRS